MASFANAASSLVRSALSCQPPSAGATAPHQQNSTTPVAAISTSAANMRGMLSW